MAKRGPGWDRWNEDRSVRLNHFRPLLSVLLALALLGGVRAVAAAEVTIALPADAQGLGGHLRDASLSVETAAREDATAQDLLAAARADYARMVGALYEVGRYGGVVSIRVDGREAADMPAFAAPARIGRIAIRVEPGPLFTFSQTRIAPLAPGTRLPEGFRPGWPAFSETIGKTTAAAGRGWREAGHAKVAIAAQRLVADHRGARLAADITLAPGPRLRFGQLVVARPGNVRPGRVRAIAGLPTGEVYHPDEVREASRRLRRTGAFSSVVLDEAETPGPDGTLDIVATLADARPRRFGFGAELSSLEGLTLSGFWLHRNLMGGAERLRIDAEVGGIGGDSGGIDYVLSARFDRPATFTSDTGLFLSARAQEKDEPDYRERSVRLGGGLSHIFSDTLTGEAGIAYQYSDIDDDLGSRRLEHVLFPARLTWDTRDDDLNARQGVYIDLDVTPFVGIGGGGLGARLYLDARQYISLTRDGGLVLATRAQLGTVNGASLTQVPPEMLFFSGGAGTVRGQSYKSLGIDLPGGRQVGGRSFSALSAELRADLSGPWSVVGFADGGFVGAGSWWDGVRDSHYGAGFGVRYDTGLGPVRVDIATPLDSSAGSEFELYIGIGQAF